MTTKQERAELAYRYPAGIQRCAYLYPEHKVKPGKSLNCPLGSNVQGSPFCSLHTYGEDRSFDPRHFFIYGQQ
jgi:hypothetical protein